MLTIETKKCLGLSLFSLEWFYDGTRAVWQEPVDNLLLSVGEGGWVGGRSSKPMVYVSLCVQYISCFPFFFLVFRRVETTNDWRRLLRPGREYAAGRRRSRLGASRGHHERRPAYIRRRHIHGRLYSRLSRHLKGTLEKGELCSAPPSFLARLRH